MPPARKKTGKHRVVPDPDAKRVGVRVRALRDEKGFTFDSFVEEVGLGRGYVSELERGLVVPSLHALKKLATALDVTMADLVTGTTSRETLFEITRAMSDEEVRSLVKSARGMRTTP